MHTRSTIYRLLAIDIDGTLVNSRDELTPHPHAALSGGGWAGIQVVLATGRRYSRTLHLVEPLGIDVPLVTAGGALVKDPKDHRTLHKTTFDPQLLRQVLRLIDQGGYDPLLCADTFAEGFDFYLARQKVKTPELQEYLDLNPNDGRIWPNLISNPPPDVFLVFTMGAKDQMLILEQILHGTLSGRISTNVLRSPRYQGFLAEITPAGVSKWLGVKRLAESWGIEEAEICAVGDDVNDIPMIRAAGLGVAMGNALPEVKAAADRVAPTHDENGLVRVVEWLFE
ncbi:MAG: Cof-type HAD-IIB family hydrolase [Thermoguttaceae bacterium]